MKKSLWIVAVAAAVLLLMWGVFRATRPASALLSEQEAQTQIEALAERFSAAIENERDVRPILEQLEPIVAQRPMLRDGRQLLGQVHTKLGAYGLAYEQYMAALSIDFADAQLHNLAGTAAFLCNDMKSAETHHLAAVRLAPDNARLLLPLADLYIKTQRWDDARNTLIAALELRMMMHDAHVALSDVYAGRGREGDWQLAVDQMETAVAKLPLGAKTADTRVVYARKLARLYAQADDPMEAIHVLDSLGDEARLSPEVSADLAGYFELNRQPILAALHYKEVLETRPTDTEAAAAAARWYFKAGDEAAARRMLKKLEAINPRHPVLGEFREKLSQP